MGDEDMYNEVPLILVAVAMGLSDEEYLELLKAKRETAFDRKTRCDYKRYRLGYDGK